MAVPIEIALPGQTQVDALAVPVAQPFGGEGARIVDEKLDRKLTELAAGGELRGDRGEALLLHSTGNLLAPRLVAVGLGKRDDVDADAVIQASEETFLKIVAGEQNPTSAYMTGKLKVKGDMGAAMKLQKLF